MHIPLACSIGALLFTWLGILSLFEMAYMQSFGLILIAVWLDMLDGYLARKWKQTSQYGANVDLLHDVLNYLLYPCILFYWFGFNSPLAIAILFLFLLAGITRLARFHEQGFTESKGMLHYQGMPVYLNHVIVLVVLGLGMRNHLFLMIMLPIASLLMVSTIPFPKPKNALLWSVILLSGAIVFLLL